MPILPQLDSNRSLTGLDAPRARTAKPPEEVIYRCLTVAAVVLLLVSLWVF
jgi:hypothetical protein